MFRPRPFPPKNTHAHCLDINWKGCAEEGGGVFISKTSSVKQIAFIDHRGVRQGRAREEDVYRYWTNVLFNLKYIHILNGYLN